MKKLLLIAALLAAPLAYGAETHTRSEYHEVRNVAGQVQGARHTTREACVAAAEALGVKEGLTRTSGQQWYNCYSVMSFKFTFKQGTTTPPTVLTPPVNFSALAQSQTAIMLRWENTPNAAAVDIERCQGANCTNFTRLSCFVGNYRQHGSLTASTSYTYRIRSSRNATCSSDFSGYAGPISATTQAVPNPPDPDPEPTDTAALSWTPPTRNTDGSALTNLAGYRIQYGPTCANRTQTVQVASASARTFTVPNLSPGTYCFAVRAYTSNGGESAESNQVTKVIQ